MRFIRMVRKYLLTLCLLIVPVFAYAGESDVSTEWPFNIETTNITAGTIVKFQLSAKGTFYVNWGDGTDVQVIERNNTNNVFYKHTYNRNGRYIIKFGGHATEYSVEKETAAISFNIWPDTDSAGVASGRYKANDTIGGIYGSLGKIFSTIGSGGTLSTQPRFFGTFFLCSYIDGKIPENLFEGVTGIPVADMFRSTFYYDIGLKGSIPSKLFSGLSGPPAKSLFESTFAHCSNLGGTIPEKLFAGIIGPAAPGMFSITFSGDGGISGAIPENLFAGISGPPAKNMFFGTFMGINTTMLEGTDEDNLGVITTIPAGLFSGIQGPPAPGMFSHTFANILASGGHIPSELFAGISGPPANNMFESTFRNGAFKTFGAELFAGIDGPYAGNMYQNTFYNCYDLHGQIPENFFGKLYGKPARNMFAGTFEGCSYLTGTIPRKIFGDLDGPPASGMFSWTFGDARSLSGYIPAETFYGIADVGTSDNIQGFAYTFWQSPTFPRRFDTTCPSGLKSVVAPDATWTVAFCDCADGYFMKNGECLKLPNCSENEHVDINNYECAPNVRECTLAGFEELDTVETWVGDHTGYWGACMPVSFPLSIQTTDLIASNVSNFHLRLSAMGNYMIDWGDGTIEIIKKTDTTQTVHAHIYKENGQYTIQMTGVVKQYSNTLAAIDFQFNSGPYPVAGIDGSLGEIFHTLPDGSQPLFIGTFAFCRYLNKIPEKLFSTIDTDGTCSGICGAPASSMFKGTFSGCRELTNIPDGLFAGISGAPASNMFQSTFDWCNALTTIPTGLFAGISGAPASDMFRETFSGCFGLTGYIPYELFAGINGVGTNSSVTGFSGTFDNVNGLMAMCPAGTYAKNVPDASWGTRPFCATDSGFEPANCVGYLDRYHQCIECPDNADCDGTMYTCKPGCVTNGEGSGCVCGFSVTTTNMAANSTFQFTISASGTFTVDCDGGILSGTGVSGNTITKADTTNETYTCTYTTAGVHIIIFGGLATGYSYQVTPTATISFDVNSSQKQIAKIHGSLGAVFPTLNTSTTGLAYPKFNYTFRNATNMTGPIPEILFSTIDEIGNCYGICGVPTHGMFFGMFHSCSKLSGSIPQNLFSTIDENGVCHGICGAPADGMFSYMFYGCSNLTGTIPVNLFAGISGAPAGQMFAGMFQYCSKLSGSIPENLFSTIDENGGCHGICGAPAHGMFLNTFDGCRGLTGALPAELFSGIRGAPATYMFDRTFEGCSGLTGSIPSKLFDNISGAPANSMFTNTFAGCSGLTGYIPYELFSGIDGVGTSSAITGFDNTFDNVNNLDLQCPAGTTAKTVPDTTWGTRPFCAGTPLPVEPCDGYLDADKICHDCPDHATCAEGIFTCDNGYNKTTNECILCTNGYGADTYETNTCNIKTCLSDYLLDVINNKCLKCDVPDDGTGVLEIQNGQCTLTCNDGYVPWPM